MIKSITANSDQYESERSILLVEKGYLSQEEASALQGRIDKAIIGIEEVLNWKFDQEAYGRDKIEYFDTAKRNHHIQSHSINQESTCTP